MIEPDMATMLAYVLTDVAVPREQLQPMLRRVAAASFNCMSVDADQSTSDTLVCLSSGRPRHGLERSPDQSAARPPPRLSRAPARAPHRRSRRAHRRGRRRRARRVRGGAHGGVHAARGRRGAQRRGHQARHPRRGARRADARAGARRGQGRRQLAPLQVRRRGQRPQRRPARRGRRLVLGPHRAGARPARDDEHAHGRQGAPERRRSPTLALASC